MTGDARVCAIVLAGGEGLRAGEPKQFRYAGGHSLLYHACQCLLTHEEVGPMVVVVPTGHVAPVREELQELGGTGLQVVVGGASRHRSARQGLQRVPRSCETVLLHDAARPFPSHALIGRVIEAARRHGAAIPVVQVRDSVVQLTEGSPAGEANDPTEGADRKHAPIRYLDRDRLRAVQTPQGFARTVVEDAFAAVAPSDFVDDGSVLLRAGYQVVTVEGEAGNLKVTTAEDLALAVRRLEEARP